MASESLVVDGDGVTYVSAEVVRCMEDDVAKEVVSDVMRRCFGEGVACDV